jgi:Flp pilus assembly protein CpaB
MDLALAQQIGVLSLALRSYYDRPGKEITGLKNDPSSAASVTGIEDPIRMSPVPKWLELRGENAVMVP